jgi:H+/Cl- antiporter ClcA
MVMLLFGTSIGMGIFIPLLYSGAAYGRAFGLVMGLHAVTRTYAIVGSVAMLAGVARVLISLTVIMMTATGIPSLVTPFMVATIFARVTGKALFGRGGIYDVILALRGIPFLEQVGINNRGFRRAPISVCHSLGSRV